VKPLEEGDWPWLKRKTRALEGERNPWRREHFLEEEAARGHCERE
jgi:hypothetical protein